MILPSQPSKFGAKEIENDFIQVALWQPTLLLVSENTLHDVTVLRIHSATFLSDALRMKYYQL